MADEKPMWARLPQETERQFQVFQEYLHMLDDPDETRRSIVRLSKRLGYSVPNMLEVWSSKNNWVERAAAYDDYMSLALVTIKQKSIEEYQQAVTDSLTQQLAALDKVLNAEIEKAIRAQMDGFDIPSTHIKRLVQSVKLKDDLARRAGKMATNYTTEPAEDDVEQRVFMVGTDE